MTRRKLQAASERVDQLQEDLRILTRAYALLDQLVSRIPDYPYARADKPEILDDYLRDELRNFFGFDDSE